MRSRLSRGLVSLMMAAMVAVTALAFPAPAWGAGNAAADQPRAKTVVTGTVTDQEGEPIIGATVQEKESGNATVTDLDGNFSISVPTDAVLVVKSVGYGAKQVRVPAGSGPLAIVLKEKSEMLDEVVVVGYGVQKKINLSGSVDRIGSKELEQRPMTDISKGLQGMMPNLNIDYPSGEPGQAANINIRGQASINGGSPLILIDGVAADPEELTRLLPGDVESVSVLKDASSAAIYGARAAFGVILITTKAGRGDRVTLTYNNNFMWKRPSQLTQKTSDPYIYLKLKNIAVLNTPWSSGHVANDERLEWARRRSDDPLGTEAIRLDPLDDTKWEYMGNRDWTADFLDRSTFSNSHQLTLSGATPRTSFYLSAGLANEDGVLSRVADRDRYTRYNMRAKGSYRVWDWLTVSNNTSFVSAKRDKPTQYQLSALYNALPVDMDRNPDGTWANCGLGEALAQITQGGMTRATRDRLQSTFSAELSLWDRMLVVTGNYTFQKSWDSEDRATNRYTVGYGPQDVRTLGTSGAVKTQTNTLYTVLDLFATFSHTFGGRHAVTGVVGYNQEYNRWDRSRAERLGLISSSLPTINLASGEQYVSEAYKDWAIRGMFFRANYILDSKYILEVNGRYDGTSRFPHDKRFGFFPSASAAWRVDGERWFAPLKRAVSQLKLRASYGSLGNQLVSEYGYVPSMNATLGSYIIDGKLQPTIGAPGLVSPDYTWEKVHTVNGGLDLAFLFNRLTASVDVYRRDTKGMLTLGRELPGVLGAKEPMENAADLKTTGWELTLGYNDQAYVAGRPLAWNVRFILSDNRTWITRFDNPGKTLGQYYVGQELGEIWGFRSDGFFQSQQEIDALDESEIIPWGALTIVPGWPKYQDLDGDGRITKGTSVDDPKDLARIGNSTPRFRYGINLGAQWGGIDLSAFFQGVGKRDYYPESYLYWSWYQQPYFGGQVHAFDFYRPADDSAEEMARHSQAYIDAGLASQNLDARFPVFQSWLADKNLGTGVNDAMGLAMPQTRYMLNGAYLRLKNLTIGYTLPQALTRKFHIDRLRVYVSGDNLAEWSQLKKYFDPEAVTDGDSFGYVYPFNRQYSFGLNVTF